MFIFEEGIDYELMKRRLTYNDRRVYIKSLTPKYALVSFEKEGRQKVFKVDIDHLVKIA